jgi:hypothetical protein
MFKDGKLLTAGEKARLHSGVFGVNKYIPDKCYNGFTLFSSAYGYTEYLVDMRGLVVHTWPVTHADVAELLPNGNILTHNDGFWLEEIRPDGSVAWRWEGHPGLDLKTHHDFYNVDGDEIVHLSRKVEPVKDGFFVEGREPACMQTDLVMRINREGKMLWEFSLSDHIEELSELSGIPLPIPYAVEEDGGYRDMGRADWAHSNTVEVLRETPLGERDPRFRAGNILLSFRALDIIAIIDPDIDEFVWAWGLGILDGQHQPTMLENGNILLFDNGTYRGYSIVREIEPDTGKEVWEYSNGEEFFSPFRSGAQRLPNGNTLITECDAGHIFEVTSEKEVVWDFYSPFVAQGDNHLGKRMHRSTRYTWEQVRPLLESREDRIIGEVDYDGEHIRTLLDLIRLYQS